MGRAVDQGEPRRFQHVGRWAVAAAIVAATLAPTVDVAGRPPAVRRSRPPAGGWDGVTAGTFQADAFSTLSGPRPDFASGPSKPRTDGGTPTTVEPAPAGAFKWSALASAESLTDEVKEMKAVLAKACAKATDFKGGGFKDAHVAFGSLALTFGVIAAYDHDIRWQKHAAAARDLFARAGFNCKVGTDQSFAESRARLEDLDALLDGNPPRGTPDRDDDFLWSQVAARHALMTRLEGAQQAARPAIASRADFGRDLDALRHAVEIVAVIGEAIQRPNFEDHDDADYRVHAAAMRDAAVAARAACEKKDYDAARAALGAVEKACNACHGDYRGN